MQRNALEGDFSAVLKGSDITYVTDIDSALAKNGSLTAYLCFGYNISLVLVSLLFVVVLFVARLVWRFPPSADHPPGRFR